MNFNDHYNLVNRHAFLSPSTHHWVRYSPEKLVKVFEHNQAKRIGVELHSLAEECIRHGLKVAKYKKTLNMFINDAIGFQMQPEQVLYYSDNCFGTADAILFHDNVLRIHDLKTGFSKVSMTQVVIYAAIFCLEYSVDPDDIAIFLRIYQNNEIMEDNTEVNDNLRNEVRELMQKIIDFDRILSSIEL